MASTDRKTAAPLVGEWVAAIRRKPYSFGFFQALRRLECLYPKRPRLGTSQRPADDPVRLAQEPTTAFEPSTLAGFEPGEDGKPHRLSVRFFGLLGPNGPLPLHVTEYAYARLRRRPSDRTFAWFLDIFHHRMLSLFYRAWANTEPTVSYDRPASDRFADYVGSLAGLGLSSLRQRDDLADLTKLYYSGWLAAQTKCADGLQAMLTDYFKLEVRIEEFVGEWLPLPEEHRCRLGLASESGRLGRSAVIGARVWSCQHKFRIVLGPLDYEDYQSLLPTGDRIRQLVAWVRNYVGDELAWDVKLILKAVPETPLNGQFRLGWTTWLGVQPGGRHTDTRILNAVADVKPLPLGLNA
jgi:type VI secretion system protein ImpH